MTRTDFEFTDLFYNENHPTVQFLHSILHISTLFHPVGSQTVQISILTETILLLEEAQSSNQFQVV